MDISITYFSIWNLDFHTLHFACTLNSTLQVAFQDHIIAAYALAQYTLHYFKCRVVDTSHWDLIDTFDDSYNVLIVILL